MPQAAKVRPRREAVMLLVQPLANGVIAVLARTRVAPWHVVLLHTAVGLTAAALVWGSGRADWVWAAALLQLKTILDNADGGLARATGQVTEFGRYLDTVCDMLVNVALFAALAQHGPWQGAALAFVSLTLMLSADFNAERLYREARAATLLGAAPTTPPPGAPAWALNLTRGFYQAVLAPQDRAYGSLDRWLFRVASGVPWCSASPAERAAWADLFSTAALVNLGLSSQFLVLGAALALGMPYAYVMFCLATVPYFILVQAARVVRYRRAWVGA